MPSTWRSAACWCGRWRGQRASRGGRAAMSRRSPVCTGPAGWGGARFDVGAEILMDAADMAEAAQLAHGTLVVNHLQALDHCPTTRAAVRQLAVDGGWADRLWVPEDGDSRSFPCRAAVDCY